MPSFPQPAFFKFSPISFWQGVYDPSFICGPAPAPHLTLFSFFSKIHSHVASWDMKKKSEKVFVVFQEYTREISKYLGLDDQAKASVCLLSAFSISSHQPLKCQGFGLAVYKKTRLPGRRATPHLSVG